MKINTIICFLVFILWSFVSGYLLGKNKQQVQYITKEIECVHQAIQKKAIIHSRPNISRDNALELMRKGIL